MANRVNISFDTIFRRKCCLESESKNSAPDAKRNYQICNKLIESAFERGNIDPFFEKGFNEFVCLISTPENANKYFREAVSLISKLCKLQEEKILNEAYVKFFTEKFIFESMPYLESPLILQETIHRYDISEKYSDMISNYAGLYEVADRIIANCKQISTRFNIIDEVKKAKYRDLQMVVENCCDMIDTYKVPSYAKYNLCIEEMNYLLEKEGIKYDKADLVKFITEYFLSRSPELTIDEINKFRRVLKENYYISDEDTSKVQYIMNPPDASVEEPTSIKKVIEIFLMKQNKTEDDLLDVANFINDYKCTTDIVHNLHKILWLYWLIYRKEIFDNMQLQKDLENNVLRNVMRRLEEDDISRSDLSDIRDSIDKINNLIVIGNADSMQYFENASYFKRILEKFMSSISDLIDVSYSNYNIEAMDFVNGDCNSPISLNEFKIFKFHNLINASINMGKYIGYKEKNSDIFSKYADSFRTKAKDVAKSVAKTSIKMAPKIAIKQVAKKFDIVNKIKKGLFAENNETLYGSIGEDNKVDICLAQYIYEESDSIKMVNFLQESCYEMNKQLQYSVGMDSMRVYYITNPGIAEIRLKESTLIELTEEEKKLVNESYDDSLDIYIENFAYTQSCLEELESYIEESNIDDILYNMKGKNLTTDQFILALETMSFLNFTEEDVKLFAEKYNRYRYSNAILESVEEENAYKLESTKINAIVSGWKPYDENYITLDMQCDALNLLEAIMEGNVVANKLNSMKNKANDNGDKNIEKKKNPFKGINLSTMKLYLEGLKKKMRDMSSKEKEFSRNIDNNFRRLVKGMKDALISDRREAIIKGSVIPSFSRCIKVCIGLAGLGIVTGNPLIPLLTAIGGFAASKNLTRKERILLLDEIETELQVVDKEISMAESKNQLKKYRILLKYKKDLQRQYQRIRYNIRVGKDILPGSASGIKNYDN